jgi:hypothetical protein
VPPAALDDVEEGAPLRVEPDGSVRNVEDA